MFKTKKKENEKKVENAVTSLREWSETTHTTKQSRITEFQQQTLKVSSLNSLDFGLDNTKRWSTISSHSYTSPYQNSLRVNNKRPSLSTFFSSSGGPSTSSNLTNVGLSRSATLVPTFSTTFDAKPFQAPTYSSNLPTTQRNIQNENINKILTEKKLTINVKTSTKFYDDNTHIPTYKTRSKNRGIALIINNIDFKNDSKAQRKGAEVDEVNIKKLFSEFGFNVQNCHKNLKQSAMQDIIRRYAKNSSLKKYDINVVVIMSHGNAEGESTQILTTDLKLVPTSWVAEQFDSENCPNLRGKPKIFIFQCCRGNTRDNTSYDAASFIPGRKTEDMLLAYATVQGYVSIRDKYEGTWYIQAICKVFMEHAHDTDVENLLKIVDREIAVLRTSDNGKQTSSFENRGFKTCYFHPKLYER